LFFYFLLVGLSFDEDDSVDDFDSLLFETVLLDSRVEDPEDDFELELIVPDFSEPDVTEVLLPPEYELFMVLFPWEFEAGEFFISSPE
jgi:hypothetical protein